MGKVIGLKLTGKDRELIKQIEESGLSNSENEIRCRRFVIFCNKKF